MAGLVALPPSCPPRIPQTATHKLLPAFELWNPISGSRVDLRVRNSGHLCHCGGRSSLSSSSSSSGRKISSGYLPSEIFTGGAPAQSRISVSKHLRPLPARAIKISRESTLEKEPSGQAEDEESDIDLCPVECVREFRSRSDFEDILQNAKAYNSLVVVDFFKTACGSCRYIEQGFQKLCKGAGNSDASVIFLKHNVMDEYEEQSEVAERLNIRVVPLFHFYKDGKLVESFATREKSKILEAIRKHTGLELDDLLTTRGS